MQKKRNLETSAGRAAAAVDKTLARLEQRRQRRVARADLASEMHKAFTRLWTSDLVRRDAQARNIMVRMARAKDVHDLDCEVNLLALRVSQLLAHRRAKKGDWSPLGVVGANARSPAMRGRGNEEPDAPFIRTFIAL